MSVLRGGFNLHKTFLSMIDLVMRLPDMILRRTRKIIPRDVVRVMASTAGIAK